MKEINTEEEYTELLTNGKNILIYFSASWCAPCRVFGPIVALSEKENEDYEFYKVDVEKIRTANINSIPTIFVKGSNADKIAVMVGATTKERLNSEIQTSRDAKDDEIEIR